MEFELLKKIVAEVLKVDTKELSITTTFVEDLGADSLDIMRIIMSIEEQFGIILPKDSIYKVHALSDVMELIKSMKNS